jgi:type IV secretion system protein VirB9
LGLVLVGPVWAERTPTPGALDARVRSVPYEADQVVRLTGQVGYALELVFESGEAFAGLASGDTTGVDFTAQGEHLFLKPRAAGVATNLTVLTDRRVYRFSYVITDSNTPRTRTQTRGGAVPPSLDSGEVPPAGVVWSVRFVYPLRVSGKEPAVPQVPQPVNERYQFCGARQLKPRRVFDDGVRTTIEFDDAQELPAVFVRNPDGSESLVNFTVVGTGLIVHRVVEHLILRRGSLTACLRNRGTAYSSSPEKDRPVAGGAAPGAAHGVSEERSRAAPAAGRPGEDMPPGGGGMKKPEGGGADASKVDGVVEKDPPPAGPPPAGEGA